MKKYIFFIIILSIFSVKTLSQTNACADSSFRIKYIFGNYGGAFVNLPDTSGKNYFTGSFSDPLGHGIAIIKTNWGDSVIFAKKIILDGISLYAYFGPNGTIICTGVKGSTLSTKPELLICKMDTNANVQWIKSYRLIQNHQLYQQGNFATKNLLIANNAIYFIANFVDINYKDYNVLAKLDSDGNIIWNKNLGDNISIIGGSPAFFNGSIYTLGRVDGQGALPPIATITKVDEATGNIQQSFGYTASTNPLVRFIEPSQINLNSDATTFSLLGLIGTFTNGSFYTSTIPFIATLNNNLDTINNFYYNNNDLLNQDAQTYSFNHLDQKAIMSGANNNFIDNYFITFDKNNKVQRTRKFTAITSSINNRSDLSLDEKQNIHFTFPSIENNKGVLEYARISNFAPNSNLGCFGKDTSILIRHPFGVIKTPYTWSNVQSNVIIASSVPYTQDTSFVTKQLVCKIVSYCDSVHIKGNKTVCVGNAERYIITKNSSCLKNLDWAIDTSFANIITIEGDSAVTLVFKKTASGYLHAAITDCVVKDSLLITATTPQNLPLIIRKDSLLCPGKSLKLNANAGYTNYKWQFNNVISKQLTVSFTGTYIITANDSCNNLVTDSITINYADTNLNIHPANQIICLYDTALISLPLDVSNINWQPSQNAFLRSNTIVAYPTQNTLFNITAERLIGCQISNTSNIDIQICPQTIFFPNTFSPNKDGLNDYFKPTVSQPLQTFSLIIYNRYGQKIFETNNQYLGWDGKYNDQLQPMAGYIYQCSYKFNNGITKMQKGYFVLIH